MGATTLAPCLSCARHVRMSEPCCPFCGGALDVAATPRRDPGVRLGRAALFAFGTGVAALAGAPGCATDHEPASDSGTDVDTGMMMAAYGAPAPDGAIGVVDTGGPAPAYGAVPADAGVDGGPAAAYGAPAIDAG